MSPAWREIRVERTRFLITVLGLTFIQLAAIGMIGFYRGLVRDMLVIVDEIGADLWVVEGGRTGPFAEVSLLPAQLDRRAESVPGVTRARRFIQFPRMVPVAGAPVRVGITGLDFPKDRGEWVPLLAGRPLAAGHLEAIADARTGLAVGDRVRLGRDDFRIVGVARDQVDMTFDPAVFVTIPDALAIGSTVPSETVLLARANRQDTSTYQVSAVLLTLADGADPAEVQARIGRWPDVSVVATEQQRRWVVDDMLGPLRRQVLWFVCLLLAVTGTILGLTMHNQVLQKAHFIALVKIFGASDLYVVRFILAQACAIGFGSFALALAVALPLFPSFPRSVILHGADVVVLAAVLLAVCVAASAAGVRRALAIPARTVLG
jgi:putative ABC transport system permease protein